MEKEERETKFPFGPVNFERRRHPRLAVGLPVEYSRINNCKSRPSRAVNVSEGGLLVHLSEPLEVGQNLKLNLFIDAGPDLDSIEALVQVVWKDIHVGKDGDYRTGMKFADVSAPDMDKLKKFLNAQIDLQAPSALKAASSFAPIVANFFTPNALKGK
jgi:c-di-GMP-binding flagellar brake protein YcgR